MYNLETFRGHLRVMEEKSLVKTDAEHEACHRTRLKSMLATSARITQEEQDGTWGKHFWSLTQCLVERTCT